MIYTEQAVDIGLAVGTVAFIALCCLGTILHSYFTNYRRFRPREDSGESLV